ncbi:Serine/Threonine kinase domain protein (macronuclear) [Tetrahymena thermophila SB210]|uniref:Serine/Threonine kinase domain protein n=1 Tax=Tetrahymena thermophila (strain SB210) TaxID=312017 RepID=I7M1T3_TETTS|nr:Serine/Threonine kinase domain protein [Tetrahymena thermophila SB210]EAR97534.2 Serine/Threonine kinase domain protein [Tetrahymena thermophila SB210]|eukprot:XP_001017779.2 Serine/Threonine kinase domain protein [Tetrahymena thermophila SB210]
MLTRYESPIQTLRYQTKINNHQGARDNSDQQILYQITMNDYKMTSRSNSIRYQNAPLIEEEQAGKMSYKWNSDKKTQQGSQTGQSQLQSLKKGSSLERLNELISNKQNTSNSRIPSSNTVINTLNCDSNNSNTARNENYVTDRQKSLKKIQKDLSSLFNKTQINNSASKQKLIVVGKVKTEIDNNSLEDAKYQRMHSENKQSNPNSLKSKYNALLDVIGKEKNQNLQSQINPAYKLDYETVRNYKSEKSDLRRQVEGMVDKIQRKLKEEENKIQYMQQQTFQKNTSTNFGNRYQQFLMQRINKDIRQTQASNNNSNNMGMSKAGTYDSQRREDFKIKENQGNNSNINGNVTAYGVTLKQKENMISKKTEQFFYNTNNQIINNPKQESSTCMETSVGLNLQNNNIQNSKALGNIQNVKTAQDINYSKEEVPNIFRVRKIKQNNLVETANRLNFAGTLEDLGDVAYLQDDPESIQQLDKFDENKFQRNNDEILRVGLDKRYSPKRVAMPINQNMKNNISGGLNNSNNNYNQKGFYTANPAALFNQTTNNFSNGIYINSNQNIVLNSSSQPNLTSSGALNSKHLQRTVNQMDQLERIVYKLRGQQQDMIRSSSNPNTRFQINKNKEINRVNSEKSLRQKELSRTNQTITEKDESKNSNMNDTSNPQNVLFRPFTTQNMNFAKFKNFKTPTITSSKEQSTTIDGIIGSSSSFKGTLNNLDRFEIGQVIGQGSYAVVRKAKDVLTDKIVAIKIYDKFRLIDPQKRNNVKREMHILQKLEHKNIIQLLMTVDTRTTVNLVMEYVSSLSLRHFLKSKPNHRLPESEAKTIFRQILNAVNYCHQNDVIHRDLKLENILISEETNEIKLIDFGFSIQAPNDKKLNMFCGTASYMSPELVQQQDYYGKPTDVWALGVLLFVLLQGRFPFKGKDDNELFKKICKNEYKISSDVSLGAQNLIKTIMKINPLERPTTKFILKDSWLNAP